MTLPAESALLPAGMIDGLPPDAAFEARVVESLMRIIGAHGYQRVKPPLIEFEDTLLAGSAQALATQSFRLMDPVSQRMLALRPDMTMQVARIAATRLAHVPRPLRLGYAGQVLRVRGSQLRPQRQFGQVGAEIVGAATTAADVEIIVLAATALAEVGLSGMSVDLGLPTLVPTLLDARAVDSGPRAAIRAALDRKDEAAVHALAPDVDPSLVTQLTGLLAACGPAERALTALPALSLPEATAEAVRDLRAVVAGLRAAAPALAITIDLVENRGFEYHTGVSFAFFARAAASELGRGGRYRTQKNEDATGVTLFMDMVLAALPPPAPPAQVLIPLGTAPDVAQRLRETGWVTVAALEPCSSLSDEARRLGCSHLLRDGKPQAV